MRYNNRTIRRNTNSVYREQLINRGRRFINQFGTARLKYPTPEQMSTINTDSYIWSLGDRYFRLAHQFYDDPRLWWVIAWFNQKPTEAHVKAGDLILVPVDLDQILNIFDV